MPDEFCPDCGTPRIAMFRYCRGCTLDFDDLDARGELPGGPFSAMPVLTAEAAPGPRRPRSARHPRTQRLAAFALTVLVIVGGVAALGMNASWDLHFPPLGPTDPGASAGVAGETGGPAATAGNAPAGDGTVAPSPATTGPTTPTGPTVQGIVERVIDGDTILVRVGKQHWRVRYIGMDTPEAVKPGSAVEHLGPEASEANQRLVGGQAVTLEQEVSDFDQYGRRLRDVWVHIQDGTLVLVGYELVRQGLARIDTFPPDVKYESAMLAAQQDARSAERGLWSTAGSVTASPGTTVSPIDLPALLSVHPVVVRAGIATSFRGTAGEYTWRTVSFDQPSSIIRWDVTSSAALGCQLDYRLVTASDAPVAGSVVVHGKQSVANQTRIATPTSPDTFQITTTCSSWNVSLTGRPAL